MLQSASLGGTPSGRADDVSETRVEAELRRDVDWNPVLRIKPYLVDTTGRTMGKTTANLRNDLCLIDSFNKLLRIMRADRDFWRGGEDAQY